jgi:hypothetical protein
MKFLLFFISLIFLLYILRNKNILEFFSKSKCFSCDQESNKHHPSKCYSCEEESKKQHSSKCYSCE